MDRTLISSGERAPDFVLPRGDGERARFYGGVGGSPALLVFNGARPSDDVAPLADAWRSAVHADAAVFVVTTTAPGSAPASFHDPDGATHRAYGVDPDGAPVAVVLDANVRVVDAWQVGDERALDRAVAWLDSEPSGAGAQGHAPVLFIPRVLDAQQCDELIAVWQSEGAVATGVEASVGAARAEAADQRRKRRRDHVVSDQALLRRLTAHLGRRVMPEVHKAFAYRANRFEGFKLGCYEADDSGFFEPHRDNLSPATAHRRFGFTLNLNDDYDGGELRFPEYGPRLHRPAAGEALVFSGAHLHEVVPVTRGRRFVLLSFLYAGEQPAPRV